MTDTHPQRSSPSSASSSMTGCQGVHHHAHPPSSSATSDRDLFDLLTAMPSSFPHTGPPASSSSASSSSNQHSNGTLGPVRRRPLATLSALRRPPIDPIILAASLSSGPQVTRHHFHHTYGTPHGPSRQMPASQRKAAKAAQEARPQTMTLYNQSSAPTGDTRSLYSHLANAGSYANCDLDDNELQAEELIKQLEIVPEVTDAEKAMYASRQAPRSVRLKLEEEAKRSHLKTQKQSQAAIDGQQSKSEQHRVQAAHAAQVVSSIGIRASDEQDIPHRPETSAAAPARIEDQRKSQPPNTGTAAMIQQALSERRAIASAPVTPSLPSLPSTPGLNRQNPLNDPAASNPPLPQLSRLSSIVRPPPLQVRCYARTRIPTPHGEIFCHLYRNNRDNKEHLALVVDPAQNEPERSIEELSKATGPRALRSRTLDEVWSLEETEMERIVRGAYVGRLSPNCQVASEGLRRGHERASPAEDDIGQWEAPLVRIHSECYTGETIGSQRCDCGEQLDEALRLILHSGSGKESSVTACSERKKIPRLARGVVVYLRQEGRGIGLLDKLMAYNLQDMGHDTVSANVLLGHLPDARSYAAAGAILDDLGVAECRLLTNNPEKMEALEAEGIRVKERVGMVPRAWTQEVKRSSTKAAKGRFHNSRIKGRSGGNKAGRRQQHLSGLASPHHSDGSLSRSILSQAYQENDDDISRPGKRYQGSDTEGGMFSQSENTDTEEEEDDDDDDDDDDGDSDDYQQHLLRSSGATLIGGAAARGVELERYLRTKIERMGHLLDLPAQPEEGGGGRKSDDERS